MRLRVIGATIVSALGTASSSHLAGAPQAARSAEPSAEMDRQRAILTSVSATDAICTASRAAILTGQSSNVSGVTMFIRFSRGAWREV